MSDRRLLRIILEETVRSPSRRADGQEVRRLYGDGFDVALSALSAHGYIANHSPHGYVALTPAGLAAAREALSSFVAN